MPVRNKLGIGGKASLRRTRTIRDLRKYFLHKGKSMEGSHGEISSKIARKRDLAHEQVMKNVALSVKGLQAKRILDVGTGYGMSLSFLARRFGKRSRIWSVDASIGVVRENEEVNEGTWIFATRHCQARECRAVTFQEPPF